MIKKIANFFWKYFQQYSEFVFTFLVFLTATILYNVDVMISPKQTGILGYFSLIIFGGMIIWVVIKFIYAWRNQIKEMRQNENSNKQR